jgi:hypothetical protein
MKLKREHDAAKASRLKQELYIRIAQSKQWRRVFAWFPVQVSDSESVWLEHYWTRKVPREGDDYCIRFRDGNPLEPYILPPVQVIIESISAEEYRERAEADTLNDPPKLKF